MKNSTFLPGLPMRQAQEQAAADSPAEATQHPADYSKPAPPVTWLMLRRSRRALYIDAPKTTCILEQTCIDDVLLISFK